MGAEEDVHGRPFNGPTVTATPADPSDTSCPLVNWAAEKGGPWWDTSPTLLKVTCPEEISPGMRIMLSTGFGMMECVVPDSFGEEETISMGYQGEKVLVKRRFNVQLPELPERQALASQAKQASTTRKMCIIL